MRATKQTVYSETNRIINQEGDVISTELKTVKKVTKDKFLQVYLEDFGALMKIKEGLEYKIILWIGKEMNYETNEIVLVKAIKERMAVDISANIRTINNVISSLTNKNVLISTDRTVFHLNPKMFFKGSIQQREILIRTIEYQIGTTDENEEIV
jgi:hypothetical protein